MHDSPKRSPEAHFPTRVLPLDTCFARRELRGFIGAARRRARACKAPPVSAEYFGAFLVLAWLRALDAADAQDYAAWALADRHGAVLTGKLIEAFARTPADAQAKLLARKWLGCAGFDAGNYALFEPWRARIASEVVVFMSYEIGPNFVEVACGAATSSNLATMTVTTSALSNLANAADGAFRQ